jgi:3-phenylpropionate/trans-cinnamate dioxygenase alpha subunit
MGGHEMLPGIQRWRLRANWKFYCDNFVGDHYHAPTTHFSAALARGGGQDQFKEGVQEPDGGFVVSYRPGHGSAIVRIKENLVYEQDLAQARRMGPEVVEYVEEWHARLRERVGNDLRTANGVGPSHMFPNLSFHGGASAFGATQGGTNLYLVLPKGVDECELWASFFVLRQAPESVKRLAAKRATTGQGAAGVIGLDDGENYDRMVDMMHAPMGQNLMMNYIMTREYQDQWKGQATWLTSGLSGTFAPQFSEHPQREYYRRYAELMDLG